MLDVFKKRWFALIIIAFVFLFFANAFKMNFFKDDFFFLQISHIHDLKGFLNFFSPMRTYSYKPLASEVFYFFIRNNIFIGRIIVFATYLIGLYFLYRSIFFLSKNSLLAKLTVFLYAISFVHVFQLYWLATYQEIVVFTALTISFYLFLRKKYLPSIFFYILALLSKETAILYVVFLVLINALINRKKIKNLRKNLVQIYLPLVSYIVVSAIFYLLFQYSLRFVTSLDNYKMNFNLKLIVNNSLWYFLWAWGLPNFLPEYMKSIFFKFTADFWKLFKDKSFLIYLYTYSAYFFIFLSSSIIYILTNLKKIKEIFLMKIFVLINFFIFLGPILFFPHRWMIRLTLPLIFISLFQAYVFVLFFKNKPVFKIFFIVLIVLYTVTNYFGVKLHESSSLYLLESRFVTNADRVFKKYGAQIEKHPVLYFTDFVYNKKIKKKIYYRPWGGSKKLDNTFHGQYFLDYYFPGKNMKAIYGYTTEKIPKNAYVIHSELFLK